MKATLLVVLLLFLFACLVELWKGENFKKVTLGNSHFIGRERVNMILALVLPTKRSTF